MLLYVGAPIVLLGLTMLTRGWIYTLKPNGRMAEKRKRRNLKVGFTTDMKLFGRKVRRLGLLVVIIGSGMVGWHLSDASAVHADRSAAAAEASSAVLPAD